MTDHKALIAEAMKRAQSLEFYAQFEDADDAELMHADADALRRLAAALEEAIPPEGWRPTEYTREDGSTRVVMAGIWAKRTSWRATVDGNTQVFTNGVWEFDTARSAMEALEK